jgi:photosystem II stability/assembly factor-like uncharacterized protein
MADNGYFYSENGGERFYPSREISNNAKSIALSPLLPSRLYAMGPRTWEWEANQLFVSIDRGHTWTRSPMTGLPDTGKHHANTVAVDGRDPYIVYACVSREAGRGAGGIYRSRDGGKTFEWFGQGLPTGRELFQHDIWVVGNEIASDAAGNLVAISRPTGHAFRRPAGADEWVAVDPMPGGTPTSLVADAGSPARFYIGTETRGVLRSDDLGKTWTVVLDQAARHVTVDAANRDRLAAGTTDGVVISRDTGKTWQPLDKHLPHRFFNLVAFAGERVLARSGGSGAFWIPLDDQAALPVKARPAEKAVVPVDAAAGRRVPALRETPDAWSIWTAGGKLALHADRSVAHSPPSSLRLESVGGPANGSAAQPIEPGSMFSIGGVVRTQGQIEECLLAAQVFDRAGQQTEWIPITDGKAAGDWTVFEQKVRIPPDAGRARLVLTLKGTGQAWIDDLAVRPVEAVFLATPRPEPR